MNNIIIAAKVVIATGVRLNHCRCEIGTFRSETTIETTNIANFKFN